MTGKTPLEIAMTDALSARRRAEALEAKSASATTSQWRLYYQKQAEPMRTLEAYHLNHAWEYAALFLDGEGDADCNTASAYKELRV